MRIGIIGAGALGGLYARLWNSFGHEVFISARDPERLKQLCRERGCTVKAGSADEAAEFAEVVLLATHHESLEDVATRIATRVSGKLVIDATNPVSIRTRHADTPFRRLTAALSPEDQRVQQLFPEARIARAFATMRTANVERYANVRSPSLAMPYAVDWVCDRLLIDGLIWDAGLAPVYVGNLASSYVLDRQSPIWNQVLSPVALVRRLAV